MAETDWRPIETAPKDGTAILIWDGVVVSLAEFMSPSTLEEWWDDVGDDDEPDEDGYQQYLEDHPLGWCVHNSCGEEIYSNPTHWQPLPAPPSKD